MKSTNEFRGGGSGWGMKRWLDADIILLYYSTAVTQQGKNTSGYAILSSYITALSFGSLILTKMTP